MSKLIDIAKVGALLALAALLVSASIVVDGFRTTPAKLNAAIDTYQKTGNEAYVATQQMRVTLAEADLAADDERKYFEQQLPATVARVNRSIDSADELLVSLKGTSDQAKVTLAGAGDGVTQTMVQVQGLIKTANDGMAPVLGNAATAVRDVDQFVTAPELKAALVNVQQTTANVAAGSAEATQILKDGRKEADALVAPQPWYRRVWTDALKSGELVWDFAR